MKNIYHEAQNDDRNRHFKMLKEMKRKQKENPDQNTTLFSIFIHDPLSYAIPRPQFQHLILNQSIKSASSFNLNDRSSGQSGKNNTATIKVPQGHPPYPLGREFTVENRIS